MSKKKAFSGSTMTLKDFHGGSIPSDLPLPSAPGVTMRPTDRPNHDRHAAWGGGSVGRPDYRGRPNSSSSTRTFDDKSPFVATTAHIGRNFDEDERKPIDGSSGPRRTVSDDILHPPGRVSSRPSSGLAPGIPVAVASANSSLSRVADKVEVSHLSLGGQSGGQTNVWAARKEAAVVSEARPHIWSEEVAASKLAHASALDKVSSGRWQTKLLVPQQIEVEVIQSLQPVNGASPKFQTSYSSHGIHVAQEGELQDSVLAKHVERSLSYLETGHNRHKELSSSVKESVPMRKTSFGINANNNVVHQPSKQSSGPDLHPSSESSERPRLNLLPRTKPLDKAQPPALDYKQENILPIKPGSGGSDVENLAEPQKLNIKPPSQPPKQLQVTIEKERNALFGGARPREFVLKERGVDADTADLVESRNRMDNEILKSEVVSHVNPPIRHHHDRGDNESVDQRIGRKIECKDNRVDNGRGVIGTNWRSDGRKINMETEKQQKERQASPETWRKPNNPENSSRVVGSGKAASAVELARAFSRSTSDPEKLRTLPNASSRNPIPFSRLTVPDSRFHIRLFTRQT